MLVLAGSVNASSGRLVCASVVLVVGGTVAAAVVVVAALVVVVVVGVAVVVVVVAVGTLAGRVVASWVELNEVGLLGVGTAAGTGAEKAWLRSRGSASRLRQGELGLANSGCGKLCVLVGGAGWPARASCVVAIANEKESPARGWPAGAVWCARCAPCWPAKLSCPPASLGAGSPLRGCSWGWPSRWVACC